jgi:hypothetical protein
MQIMTELQDSRQNARSLNLYAAEKGQRRITLHAIFQHPLTHNLEWREVIALIDSIGVVSEKRDNEFLLEAGDQRLCMKRPHGKDIEGPDVIELRRFLTRAGWSPEAAPLAEAHSPHLATIIVIDHRGAEVYQVTQPDDDATRQPVVIEASHHVLHDVDRKQHDADHDEIYPQDERFFEAVTHAIAPGGQIVIIGHGKGQSNEGDHLRVYLDKHHKGVCARIVREIVADLPSLTTPELLALGRHGLRY